MNIFGSDRFSVIKGVYLMKKPFSDLTKEDFSKEIPEEKEIYRANRIVGKIMPPISPVISSTTDKKTSIKVGGDIMDFVKKKQQPKGKEIFDNIKFIY